MIVIAHRPKQNTHADFKRMLPQIREHLGQFGEKLPAAVKAQLEALEARLG